jgi:hypothetical protein
MNKIHKSSPYLFGGSEHFLFFHHMWDVILPIDFHIIFILFKMVQTTNQCQFAPFKWCFWGFAGWIWTTMKPPRRRLRGYAQGCVARWQGWVFLGQMMWGKTTHIMNHGGFYGKKINTKGFFLFFLCMQFKIV